MTGYLEASRNAARAVNCAYFRTVDVMGQVLRQIDSRFAIPIPYVYEWFRSNCDEEPPDQPSLEPVPPPFTGGQCVGVLYRVTFSWVDIKDDGGQLPGSTLTVNNLPGPISFVGDTPNPLGQTRFVSLTIIYGNDQRYYYGQNDTSGFFDHHLITSVNVSRMDNQPDTCGDPGGDSELPPTTPPPDSTTDYPINYTDNGGNVRTVNVRFVLGSFTLNVNNQISVPFTMSFAPDYSVHVNGSVNSDGTVEFNYGNTNYNFGGSPPCTPNPDNFVPDEDTPDAIDVPMPDEPPAPEEDDPTPAIRAVIVTVTQLPPKQSIIFQNDNPDIMIPRLGNIQFLIGTGTRAAWTEDIPVRNRRHFITCPWEGGAIAVRGTPALGVSWVISPVYARQQYPVELLT